MSVALSLPGPRILVTGAAGGLGRAVAHRVVQCGGSVAIADVDAHPLDALAAQLANCHSGSNDAAPLPGDLGDVERARDLSARAAPR